MIVHGFGKRGVAVESQVEVHGAGPFFIPDTRQVHGATIAPVSSQMGDLTVEADAFVTSEPGVVCSIATADCLPILIWDVRERVIAAVHAGWRGVAVQIVSETVAYIRDEFSDADLRVAMGPAMAASCYEVGDEVVSACGKTVTDIAKYLSPTRPGHHLIDLKGIVVEQLERAGVTLNCIEDSAICTHCNSQYASYRRGDRGERQYSWVVII